MRLEVEQKVSKKRVSEVVAGIQAKTMQKSVGIRELFAGGMSIKDISDVTGIRYTHVYNVVRNEVLVHGLQVVDVGHGKKGSVQKEQIIELLEQGKTITEVGAELKVIYNRVWQVAKEAGLTNKQKTESQNELMKVEEGK